ncbi:MAG TPA: hypothetical protein VKD67_13880 [Acidimicrobiales bacterium]|nr:hypothetical protein [Acidimicrobiales bacterium]
MAWDLERAYRDHLTSADEALLTASAAGQPLAQALASPDLELVVFDSDAALDPSRMASPFLTFAVAVHGVARKLARTTYIDEWVGPRQRVPVFAVEPLRHLLDDPLRRFFFVELLASYTHVVSGSTWTATRRGWRRRRFSELDPVQLAGLLDAVPPGERPGVLRRLGDLALFLTGVFPDHTARTTLGRPSAEVQLLRSAHVEPARVPPGSQNAFELLELLGSRWYRLTVRLSAAPSASVEVLAAMAEHFTDARRILNVVTDTYLFPLREQWFGRPAA